ncbi:MAG: hypothetical protein ACD_79C01248G0002 [uncultured bacterium]|nr:MAG: hypothetical protein ACD_79C01248G0002 [uncultured bacterium]
MIEFEWDKKKAEENLKKHEYAVIRFPDTE